MQIQEILFYVLACLTIVSSLMMVFSKNSVHSILYLIVTFFCISGHYVLLNAQFIAVVNVIVYAGAIMVLFLFVVMLMNLNDDKKTLGTSKKIGIASIISVLFIVLTVGIITENIGVEQTQLSMESGEIGFVENLGKLLYSEYVLPFELSSILFISAMLGAVMLSKKDEELINQ